MDGREAAGHQSIRCIGELRSQNMNYKPIQPQEGRLQLADTNPELLTSADADERGEINTRQNDLWRAGKIEDVQPGAAPPLALIYGRNITNTCCQRVNICLATAYST